ncbi:MAG: glycosyltransferase [Eubacteriales bacterium]
MSYKAEKIKVLHIIPSLNSGGAEKLIEESLPIMKNNYNIDVEVLLLTDKGNIFDKKLKDNNIKTNVSPHQKIRSIKNIFYILKHIKRNHYDIVHSHLFPCNYWASIASKLILKNKPKFITTEHNTHNKRRDKFYFRPIERFIYSGYDTIISISEGTQQNLINWIKPKGKDKFVVIENGINLVDFINAEPYKKSDLDSKFNESTRLLCMVGSFSKQKDQATIIRAMKDLPDDIFLLLVGGGSLKQEYEKLAKKLEVDDRVKFLGIRKDVPRIFKTSDIVIVSSHWEGFGLVAAEGMAAGKPVIASDVPGLSEVVRGAGVLFEKGSQKELIDNINSFLNNKAQYYKITEKCLERSNRYNIKRMVEEYLKVYNLSPIRKITKKEG